MTKFTDKADTPEIVHLGGRRPIDIEQTIGARRALLVPGALAYGAVSGAVRTIRRRMSRRRVLGASVVSIGNLEVGGTGKTPLAIHLLQRLEDLGYRPVYLSRAYGGDAERLPVVTVLLPGGPPAGGADGADLWMIQDTGGPPRGAVGDEGAMVARRCPKTPLVFARSKQKAIEWACSALRPTHIVLDDAFQSWSVPRDFDVVLLDAIHPFGNGHLLPAGSLREPPGALSRADCIGFNGVVDAEHLGTLTERIERYVGNCVPVFGIRRSISLLGGNGGAAATVEGPVASLSSIARPPQFERSIREAGYELRLCVRYPDHYRYTAADAEHVSHLLAERGIANLVSTEKDSVKLESERFAPARLWIARLQIELIGADPLVQMEKPQAKPAVVS